MSRPILFQINIEVNSGSTGRIAEQIGLVAMKSGFDSYITFARGYNQSQSKVIKIGNKFSILFHLLKTRLLGEHLNGSRHATLKLIQQLKTINPDIIHLHQMHGYYLNVPLLFEFLREFNKPVVWTLHDCWAFTGHCSYFTLVGCDKWKTECNKCPQSKKYPKSLYFDKSKSEFYQKDKLFNAIKNLTFVGVSDWVANLAKFSFLSKNKITTIANCIDLNLFNPKENALNVITKYGLDKNKKFLIASGTTWIKSKGLEDYILLSEMLPFDYQLILVGINESISKSISSKIKCIKRTESQLELAELYSAADILLCLSYQESFGLTPIEAMACGTPSIVYNNTALNEIVTDKTGIKVETGDLNAVIEAIKHISKNGKQFYSQNCIQRANDMYDMNKNYLNYVDLYHELLKSK
jgi:putative colanic acid biosynthesis glycosyltransferase